MNTRSNLLPEHILCAAAAVALLVSAQWTLARRGELTALRGPLPRMAMTGGEYARIDWPAPQSSAAWLRPEKNAQGPVQTFDLFTPPTLFRHETGLVTAVPVLSAKADEMQSFGLELLGVQREPFRLQLLGYAVGADGLRAIFEAPSSSEVFLDGSGSEFEKLGLSLVSLELRRLSHDPGGAAIVPGLAAFATLRESRTGDNVVLRSDERRYTDVPLARLRNSAELRARWLREGDELAVGEALYRIERIQLDPPEVIVSRNSAGAALPDIRILTPVGETNLAKRMPQGAPRSRVPALAAAQP